MDKNERISEPELNTKNVSKHEKMTDVDSENDNENVAAVVDNNNGYESDLHINDEDTKSKNSDVASFDSDNSSVFVYDIQEDYLKEFVKCLDKSDDGHGLQQQEEKKSDKNNSVQENVPNVNKRRPVNKRMVSGGGGGNTVHNRGFHRNNMVTYQQYIKTAATNNSKNCDNDNPYLNVWGHRTNIVDRNGHIHRVVMELNNYLAVYRARYFYYFDLVNGKYPQFVRCTDDNMEIWRMSFNIYATGFSDLIAHLGEIHSFYQMETIDNELKWVYKDFNFYPNKMRYGIPVHSYDIADIYSRFVKFVCLKDNIVKNFPNVIVNQNYYVHRKFQENLQAMKNRINEISLVRTEEGDNSGGCNQTEIDKKILVPDKDGRQSLDEQQTATTTIQCDSIVGKNEAYSFHDRAFRYWTKSSNEMNRRRRSHSNNIINKR
ncbi:hypothetical protein DERF_006647 [Dermatophagoides farinae]|uniref:Uncharacterized protein n=1 Tax=Dermatophagoides farinae TaxID=6954 RepID=A0A922HYU9_DERFA|nr:hypothetical protein DERF_006647 [Dermatophagoides farinae]